MVERGEDVLLAVEAVHEGRTGGVRGENLEGGALAQTGDVAFDQIDGAHAAGTDAADEGIGTDVLDGIGNFVGGLMGQAVAGAQHGEDLIAKVWVGTVGGEEWLTVGGGGFFSPVEEFLETIPLVCGHAGWSLL